MNAYVSSFVYCDNIQTQNTPQGQQNQIIGPLQVLAPLVIPSHFSFSVACGIVGLEPNVDYHLVVAFLSNDGTELNKATDINFQVPGNLIEEGIGSLQLNIDMRNVFFEKKGQYRTRIILNDKILGEYPIEVVLGKKK